MPAFDTVIYFWKSPVSQTEVSCPPLLSNLGYSACFQLMCAADNDKLTDGALQQDIFSAISGSFASRKTEKHEGGYEYPRCGCREPQPCRARAEENWRIQNVRLFATGTA